jgi:hypothetical protein
VKGSVDNGTSHGKAEIYCAKAPDFGSVGYCEDKFLATLKGRINLCLGPYFFEVV